MTPQQELFQLVRIAPQIRAHSWHDQKDWLFSLDACINQLTPRQFSQVFPITKEYKGRFWGCKDYYTVTDWINENVGMDNLIPDGLEFLFEYLNINVQIAAVTAMHIIGKLHQRQTGKDMLIEFLESQGIHVHKIQEDGDL
ncbi:hypothetical protein [Limosilactobacillus reuteri]|uniref:hypothetical protein n=1 Tax=Limosilactobacillus reuteri TaxID=1598 RepID=UPI002B05A04B|nr:hypothetical protein [Limosilactobacillus reuteri]